MRTFSTVLLAMLLIAALFWGNCFTCPQLLLSQAHSCCHKSKQSAAKCDTQVLRQFVKADATVAAPPVTAAVTVPPIPAHSSELPVDVSATVSPTPPILITLRV